MNNTVPLLAELPALQAQAEALARHWGFPTAATGHSPYQLVLTEQRLELRPQQDDGRGAIYVDWLGGRAAHRRRFGGGRGQPLARAVGLKAGLQPRVFDATAGLGSDGFVLACLGCTVTLVEQHPVVAALLQDGLQRASQDPETATLVAQQLRLVVANSIEYMGALATQDCPEVVYLDPMYPERQKSSLVKKEMQALQSLVGKESADPALLPAALACARDRVVVKRPMAAPCLDDRQPTMTIKGKNHRYDVYVRKAMTP